MPRVCQYVCIDPLAHTTLMFYYVCFVMYAALDWFEHEITGETIGIFGCITKSVIVIEQRGFYQRSEHGVVSMRI